MAASEGSPGYEVALTRRRRRLPQNDFWVKAWSSLGLRQPVESDVERAGRMREATDADALDAGLGDLANCFQRHPAGGFELDAGREFAAAADGDSQLVRRHVVEEHDVGAGCEDGIEHVERIDFNFDQHVFGNVLGIDLREETTGRLYRPRRR